MGLSAALLPPHLAPVGHHSPPVWFPWHRRRTERGMSLLTRLQVHPSVHTHGGARARAHTEVARTGWGALEGGSGNKRPCLARPPARSLAHSQSTFPQSCNKSRAAALSLPKPTGITLYATCAEKRVAVKSILLNGGYFFFTPHSLYCQRSQRPQGAQCKLRKC